MQIVEQILNGERAVSSSALKEAKKSIRDFIHYYKKPKTTAKHFDFGNAAELWLIDKPEFHKQVAIMDESKRPEPLKNYQTKVNQVWKAEFYEQNADKYIIAATGTESFEAIMEMERLAQMHPAYDMLFQKDMLYQDAFEWTCPVSGLKRYSRTDLYGKESGIIVDIKTYQDENFAKACIKNDWPIQAIDQITGAIQSGKMQDVTEYYWFAISKTAPYFIDVVRFDFDSAMPVEESYKSVLLRLKNELNEDTDKIVWHDAPITVFKLPGYYK